ncbi:MAG TPA: decaprenyl-phosphate phosphoribosyltransferase [Vicinamibacterales bacterium]|nr:decaprenyl-phosphate phosphoribosyltransferase [Vicinamibacterales bacterium]
MARSPVSPASPAIPATAGDSARTRPGLAVNLLRSLRPSQWIKNLLVFAGLIFGEKLGDPSSVERALVAFGVFCLLSSAVYLINDVLDREADRRHPVKSRRPIASGAISPRVALATAVILLGVSFAGAFALNRAFGLVAVTYFLLQALYSLSLKHVVILDVLVLAGGFVLRAYGGAVAIDVIFSHWLLLLTLLLALFLGLSKRRAELVTLADDARGHRQSLAHYSPYLLDQMIGVVTASTLLAYAFYTISPETVQKFHTDRLLLTVPFPLYGIFRYLYLVHQRDGGGNPSEMLLTDIPLLVCVALWVAAVIVILYTSWL